MLFPACSEQRAAHPSAQCKPMQKTGKKMKISKLTNCGPQAADLTGAACCRPYFFHFFFFRSLSFLSFIFSVLCFSGFFPRLLPVFFLVFFSFFFLPSFLFFVVFFFSRFFFSFSFQDPRLFLFFFSPCCCTTTRLVLACLQRQGVFLARIASVANVSTTAFDDCHIRRPSDRIVQQRWPQN